MRRATARRVVNGSALRAAARPSTSGVWAITAATAGSPAATSSTSPPASEKPHRATRAGSTSGSVRAWATAAVQSAR